MRYIILTVCVLISIVGVEAQTIPSDKKKHIAYGFLISGATYSAVYAITKNEKKSILYSIVASTSAGLAKELYDHQVGKVVSSYDVGATSLGGITGTLGALTIFNLKLRFTETTCITVKLEL